MSETAFTGPVLSFGITMSSTGGGLTGNDLEHNSQRAPSIWDLGDAMLDPRAFYAYTPGHAGGTTGFYNNVGYVDYVPTTINSSALVSTTASSGLTTFTLVAASSANGTYQTTIIAPETGQAVSVIAIDSTAAVLAFGSAGAFRIWNPGAGTGRNITIHPSTTGDLGTYSVAGRDMYGYKMTETIAGGATSVAGKKAFKYISSITNTTTPVSTGVSVGFGDIYGFPFAVPYIGIGTQVELIAAAFGSSAGSVALSSVVVNLASTVAIQTSTTPDVRGTYASSVASNGTLRLQIQVTPSASAIATITSTNVSGLFGLTQFSSV